MSEKPNNSDVEFLLSEYLDGSLPRGRRVELERRLREDAGLREELNRYAQLETFLAEIGQDAPEVDEDAQRAEIMAAVERKMLLDVRARRRAIPLRPLLGLAAAAVLLVAAAAAFLWMRGGPGGAVPAEPVVIAYQVEPVSPAEGAGEVSVEFHQPAWENVRMFDPALARTTVPPGTVVVTVGPREQPEDMPLWIQ